MLKTLIAVASLVLSIGSSCQRISAFDSLFRTYYNTGLFEGTALIADSAGIVYHKSFGFANHDSHDRNTNSTIFRLGSLEKQFTAMLTLQLINAGKLKLDGTISEYLPEYRKETGAIVSIRHLLSHSSGIPNYSALPSVWDDSLQIKYKPGYLLSKFCSGDLEFKPGTMYRYSNTGYFILAQILARVTGKSPGILLQEKICMPLGMKNTGLDNGSESLKNKARGYYRLGNSYTNEPYIYAPNTIGAASIYSTAYDLYLWDRALYDTSLVPASSLQSYCSPLYQVERDYAYGFGWEFTRTGLGTGDTVFTMEHSGAIRAFRAVIFRIPTEKKCIILLSNCGNQSGYELIENSMLLLRGKQWKKPKALLADTLYAVIKHHSVATAVQTYTELRRKDPTAYDYSSSSLSFLAERLMMFDMYDAAAGIYELAVMEDPGFIAGYFYLGQAYEKSGNRENAVKAYKTAISHDPSSRAGRDAAFNLLHLKKSGSASVKSANHQCQKRN